MRNTKTTVVIAAGAVLAAVIVTRTPAQQEYGKITAPCCFPNAACLDLRIEECAAAGGVISGVQGTFCEDGVVCPGTIPPPTVVGVGLTQMFSGDAGTNKWEFVRAWSDGQVDATRYEYPGGVPAVLNSGPTVIIPGSCPTDVNRDGDTGVQDFLTLLGGWGACR